ncbi:Ferric uptake regulator [Desulfonema limicola]|uniref:Ferric uptake regulation protein n=1 Tax=Desulfonema limicola TaxID=45656 RepID=A0A975BE58_9BACT|nr:transcriptional repressor [Desulfonema limicola]QTA83658.1 Ferric uptake regulator [Desulfonema limicola]
MKHIHHQEKEQFKQLFSRENIDKFEDRFKILEIFLQSEQHVTEQDLIQSLNKNGHEFNPEFVADTLNLMCRFGFAQKNEFDDGVIRYEHRHLGDNHDHMICTRCGKITEFRDHELEAMHVRVASMHGFHMLQHGLSIYGICSECISQRTPLIPLALGQKREILTVSEFTGGMASRMRLLSMGLRIGDKVEIISNSGNGQLVIAVDCKRYAIGRGLAEKILVRPGQ